MNVEGVKFGWYATKHRRGLPPTDYLAIRAACIGDDEPDRLVLSVESLSGFGPTVCVEGAVSYPFTIVTSTGNTFELVGVARQSRDEFTQLSQVYL